MIFFKFSKILLFFFKFANNFFSDFAPFLTFDQLTLALIFPQVIELPVHLNRTKTKQKNNKYIIFLYINFLIDGPELTNDI